MAVTLVLLADFTWPLRILVAVLVAVPGAATVWQFVLLRGPHGVRSLEWPAGHLDEGRYFVWLGNPGRRLPALPRDCQKYGVYLWVLRFETAEGTRRLLVDARCQQTRALRRLSRCLVWA